MRDLDHKLLPTLPFLFNQNSVYDGVDIVNCNDIHIAQSRSDGNGNNGFLFEGTSGAYISSVTAYHNSGSGWQFYYPGSGGHNINFFFWNAVGDTSGGTNWNISDITQSSFTNIWGSSQISTGVSTGAQGILLSSSNVHDVDFHGGKTLYNNGDGVYIFNSGGTSRRRG